MKTLEEKILDDKIILRRSRIAFTVFLLFASLMIVGWRWLTQQPLADGAIHPLRSVLNINEKLFSKLLSENHYAKIYPKSLAAPKVRLNGDIGMGDDFEPSTWKLQVIRKSGDTLSLSLEDIQRLPKTEVVFNFKCIEGWSQVTCWGGVKFSDFISIYHLDEEIKMNYVGLNTPDQEYYVGIDRASIIHPQTILCYEMNGEALPMNQGYPLRLIIPVKYGIKHLKRIGTIFFNNERPKDYWFERGYDYYSGL